MKTRHWIIAGSAGVVGLAALALLQHEAAKPGSTSWLSSPRSGVAAGPCAFEVGQELAYDVRIELERTLRQGPLSASAGQKPIASSVAAELHGRVLSLEPRGAVLLVRYTNVEFEGGGESLTAPFLLRVAPRCRLDGFARHVETAAELGRAQQGIAYELNFVATVAGTNSELEADDSVGHYRARFSASENDGRLVLARGSVAYTQIWDAPRANVSVTPSESRSQVVLDDEPWLAQLSSHQVLRGAGGADLESRVEASRVGLDFAALAGADSDPAHYVWENLLPRLAFPRAARAVTKRDLAARAAVRDQSLEQAVDDYVARARTTENFAEIWPPLTTYLEARPEETERFVRALRRGEVPPEGRAAGWVAVGQARTPEARDTLLAVMRDEQVPAVNRMRATFALVDRDDVGAPLTAELASYAMGISTAPSEDARFFAREAALAMGMMAGLRRETDAEVRATALGAIPKLLASQHTASDLSPVFGAIANLGDASTLPLVEPYTRHVDARVRAGAAHTFRHLPPGQLTSWLAPWLSRETDVSVKRELYLTLAKNMHDSQETAESAVIDRAIVDLKSHPGVITRRALIKVLGVAARHYEPARQALMAQARKETGLRSGLYTVITQYLGADDLLAALSQTEVP